jgi:diadenylate cyclase
VAGKPGHAPEVPFSPLALAKLGLVNPIHRSGASGGRGDPRRGALAAIAPGTALREGLERILHGNTGALIVLGHDQVVEDLCSGGFELHAGFSPTRLRELAKMDGAIVLDEQARSIVRAAVQLVPDPAIRTAESGTRHRTAERVAAQTGYPVISVSKSMRVIVLFVDGTRYVLETPAAILTKANQALATLERYKARLAKLSATLTALEIEGIATVRDITAFAQLLDMIRRIASEIDGYMIELGTEGRLLAMQLAELVSGADTDRDLLVRDYLPAGCQDREAEATDVLTGLEKLSAEDLLDSAVVAAVLKLGGGAALDELVSPRGYRLLARVPRLPAAARDRLVDHFGGLQKLLAASVADLREVPGIGPAMARNVREGLVRLAESSIAERWA